jgi:ribosomal protein L6P/L9E
MLIMLVCLNTIVMLQWSCRMPQTAKITGSNRSERKGTIGVTGCDYEKVGQNAAQPIFWQN